MRFIALHYLSCFRFTVNKNMGVRGEHVLLAHLVFPDRIAFLFHRVIVYNKLVSADERPYVAMSLYQGEQPDQNLADWSSSSCTKVLKSHTCKQLHTN